MRTVSDEMTQAWLSPDKTGPNRPVVRATVQRFSLRYHRYDTSDQIGDQGLQYGLKDLHVRGYLTSALFGSAGGLREISNIAKCDWTRATTQDVAECTLTLLNTQLQPLGKEPRAGQVDDFDNRGSMTPTRGSALTSANRWGYDKSGWADMIIPDRMVKTYEGYGADPDVYPAQDSHLMQSGTWIIDEVTYSSEGDIEIKMRDVGRLLIDQIVFPPAVPWAVYPLFFTRQHTVNHYIVTLGGGEWRKIAGAKLSSSNKYFRDKGIQTADGTKYIANDGSVLGHREAHALTPDDGEYWMSTGMDDIDQRVWWQADFAQPTNLGGVRVTPAFGPYRVWISVKDSQGRWMGRHMIPETKIKLKKPGGGRYDEIDLNTRIPFLRTFAVGGTYQSDGGIYGDHDFTDISDDSHSAEIPLRYLRYGATAIRITLRRLQEFPFDSLHPRRADLGGIEIYTGPQSTLTTKRDLKTRKVGNYKDWSDVVRWMIAWGGWFWPEAGTTENYWAVSPTENNYVESLVDDPVLPRGALWADIQDSGTGGVSDLTVDMFDKRPFMDVIADVRTTLGFISFIDETGAFIWRMPNVWKLGNFLSPGDQSPKKARTRTTSYVTIDEEETLLGYKMVLSSRDNRERVFVGDSTAHVGWTVKGYTQVAGHGLRRVAGWTDKEIRDEDEARVAADLIVTKQMFEYRKGVVTIPGYPKIQIDDQVKILERTTEEMFFHYVQGISSSLDVAAGTWTYTLNTHWLGEDADQDNEWAVHRGKLQDPTERYLEEMGSI